MALRADAGHDTDARRRRRSRPVGVAAAQRVVRRGGLARRRSRGVHNEIEARNARGELDRALTYASIVADLEVLGACDAIVGTAASWVSRLIFLLIVGNTGRTPPHVFLDQRFGGPADVW